MPAADLRPMTLGEVLDRTFKLYTSEFWLFTGIMSLPFLVLFVFNVLVGVASSAQVASMSAGAGSTAFSPAALVAGIGGGLLLLVLTFILTGAGQAATIFAVSDIYLGRAASIRSSFQQVRGHVAQALGAILLMGLVIGAGFILLIIPGIFLMCRCAVTVPASMLEDEGPGTALSRSMELTKGFAMQVFVVFLLAWALALGAAMVFQLPFTLLAATPRPHVLPLGWLILQDAGGFVAQVLVAPIQTIAFSLMYYNLRVRKEGFDLEHLMGSLGAAPTPGGMPAPGTALPS
jgi:hypothetical protein